MKKVLIAAASITAIIGVRMILSFTISEQAAEVFTRLSTACLFFYFICGLSKNNSKAALHKTNTPLRRKP